MTQILIAYALFGLAASMLTGLVLLCGECYSWLLGTMILSGIILSSYLIYRGRNDKTHRAGKHGPEFAPKIGESLSRYQSTTQEKRKDTVMTQSTTQQSMPDKLYGAALTLVAAALSLGVLYFVHHLLTHGVTPTIPIPTSGLRPEVVNAASEAARIIAIPIVLLALWAGLSRESAHNIPEWKFFWYVDFVPSAVLFLYLLIGVPAGIWLLDTYQMPGLDALLIWASFLFVSFFDVKNNGRHRMEHAQSPFSQGSTQAGSGSAASEHATSKDEPHTDENTGELVVPTRLKVTSFVWAIKRPVERLVSSAPLVEHEPSRKVIEAEAPPSGSSVSETIAQPVEPVQAH